MADEKHIFEPPIGNSHARTKPLVVENVKARVPAPTGLRCPTCGGKMTLVRSPGSAKLTASCPNCAT